MKMKPSCESCGSALSLHGEAYVCSYECTFCSLCASRMSCACPNCAGELVRRPRRVSEILSPSEGAPG